MIGFIGLGIMGKPMAKNLVKAGEKLVVNDINAGSVAELAALGAEVAQNGMEAASKSEVILTMLPNSPEVKEVVLGKRGVLDGIRKGAILVDMSSISPLASMEIEKAIRSKGAYMLDAPVSGGEPKAVDGTLAFMVGGAEEQFASVKPILGKMGSSVTHVGKIGSGNITKLANQIIVALNIAAVSEAFVLAAKAGVDPLEIYHAIRGGLAGSAVLDAKIPKILDRNFNPGFRVELHIKDLANALDMGQSLGVTLPLAGKIFEIMQGLNGNGLGKMDHCAVIRHYEKLAQLEVQRKPV